MYGNAAAEQEAMDTAINKARQSHLNLSKLLLKVEEAGNSPPYDAQHKTIIDKLNNTLTWLNKAIQDYSSIVSRRVIPGLTVPTTSTEVKKKVTKDLNNIHPQNCVNKYI